jgi:hypothetical protein
MIVSTAAMKRRINGQKALANPAPSTHDPSLHLAANFAVTHNAALW